MSGGGRPTARGMTTGQGGQRPAVGKTVLERMSGHAGCLCKHPAALTTSVR